MSGEQPVRLRPKRPCPTCGKPAQQKSYPFCSARCAHVDLNRWLRGVYSIPAEEADDPVETSENPRSGNDHSD
jgi:endogenous inhibitor of DNA gyrase (YacG/DUF329 family)